MEKKTLLKSVLLVLGTLSLLFIIMDTGVKFSDNPKVCTACHTMEAYYQSHVDSNHKQFKCVDCHAPKSYGPKVAFKVKAGLHDLIATATGKIPAGIKATEETQAIIKANCIRCHTSTVENTFMAEEESCVRCHRGIKHQV